MFMMSTLSEMAFAYTAQIDGIYYNFSGDEAIVTYYMYGTQNQNAYTGNVIIPETVTYGSKNYSVTKIDNSAFSGCTSLSSITIGNKVTSIGGTAFSNCTSLTSINIPSTVTSIGYYSFQNCESLKSLILPNGIATIESGTFSGCNNLESIEIPNSVTKIEDNAFTNCSSLASVSIGNSVESIGNSFSGCTSLTSVHIPASVTKINVEAFRCPHLSTITVDSNNKIYDSRDNCNAIIETATNTLFFGIKTSHIPSSVTSIGYYAFKNLRGLVTIDIPSSVTTISGEAFYFCYDLTSICFPSSVTSIGYEAFRGCGNLTSVSLPSNLTKLGDKVFSGCPISSIIIPKDMISINSSAFQGCSLGSIIVEEGNSFYDSRDGCNAIIETATNKLIIGCKNTQIPSSVTSIGGSAYYGRTDIITIEIPNNIKSVESQAFSECSNLTSVNISDLGAWCKISFEDSGANPLSIAHKLCLNGEQIKDLVIPNSVDTLYAYSFCGGYFSSIQIPEKVYTLHGASIFRQAHIGSVHINWYIPNSCFSEAVISNLEISGARANSASTYAFSSATIDNVNIPYSDNAFSYPSSNSYNGLFGKCKIKKAVVDRDIKDSSYFNNARGVFHSCNIDTLIVGPNAINHANDRLYSDCTIENLYFNGISEISSYCYNRSSGWENNTITNLYLLEGITKLKKEAFYNTTALINNHLILPASLVSAGSKALYAFADYVSVTSLAQAPPSIEDDTFAENTYNNTLYVPVGSETLYANATGWKNFRDIVEIPNPDKAIQFADSNVKKRCVSLWDIDGDGELTYAEASHVSSLKGFTRDSYETDAIYFTSFDELAYFTGLTEIPYNSFNSCSRLVSVCLPQYISSIGERAFYSCGSLVSVKVLMKDPINIYSSTFYYRENATLYVPKGSKAAYEAADYWKEFKEIVEVGTEPQTVNTLSANACTILTGSSSALGMGLTNEDEIIMTEFYMQLPEGITIEEDEDGYPIVTINSERENNHVVEVSKSSNGDYHFLSYSSKNDPFKGNEGELFNINLVCADGVAAGTYQATVKNIIMSDINKNELAQSDFTFDITVMDVAMGDANGDGRINGMDIVEMVDYIMERPSDSFVPAAADLTGDSKVNGMDLVELVSLVMAQGANAPSQSLAPRRGYEAGNVITGTLHPLNAQEVSLGVSSNEQFVLAQCVVTLSDGQQLLDVTTDSKHVPVWQSIGNGRFHVLVYSARNTILADNNALLTFHTTGPCETAVKDMLLVDADRLGYWLDDFSTNGVTGINRIEDGDGWIKQETFDLQGRKMETTHPSSLKKGIYIIKGKKVTVK